jgi:hypothetical protein
MISKLCSAIATAEGWFHPDANVLPRRNNNPGNLRASPLERPKPGGYVQFRSPQEGIAALYQQVALHVLRGKSLREFITAWAPPSDGNDTENYIRETARRCGITDIDRPLMEYLGVERIG